MLDQSPSTARVFASSPAPGRSLRLLGLVLLGLAAGCNSGSDTQGPGEDEGGDQDPPGTGGPRTFESLVIDPPCARPGGSFGFSTVPMDWNGDGILDIGIGAPGESRVYVALGGGPTPYGVILPFDVDGLAECPNLEPAAWRLGESVTAADVDGDGDDELIAGAPRLDVDGVSAAGAVLIFGLGEPTDEPYRITADVLDTEWFGSEVRADDLNQDGVVDLVIGSPRATTRSVQSGSVTVVYSVFTGGENQLLLPNPMPVLNGNFGFHLALDDGNADGYPEVFVTAVGNTDSNGVVLSGQVYGYWGPPTPDGWFLMDDAFSVPDDFPRFGMHVDAAGGTVVVGAPRKDLPGESDSGRGFRWDGPTYQVAQVYEHPTAKAFDLFGYRVQAADVIGDERIDQCFVSLPTPQGDDPNVAAIYIFDGGDLDVEPYEFLPLPDSGSHFAVGFSTAQLVPGEQSELILGDSRYDRPGAGGNEDSGRVVIYF